ncbi:MAG TPA: acyl-ACP--UDP-N-acetylglucosamine O-acyltransferase [Phycisphaerae bacterium]|jgi:UDP-N-acetylglucosamine acyltransferase
MGAARAEIKVISTEIHRTAIVDPGARLGRDVSVGAYSVIGPYVTLGDGCRIYNHVTLAGHTTLGAQCQAFPGAALGLPPQDLKYKGELTRLEIGDANIFRETVTVHPGTSGGGFLTRIGSHNLFCVGSHIAHDCTIGDHCVLSNSVHLAGHVRVEDHVTFGGICGVHHFVTIGKHAMIGGLTRVATDVPPFMVYVAARTQPQVRMVNGVGLKRRGFSEPQIAALKIAYMRLFSRRARASGKPILESLEEILGEQPLDENVEYLCRFVLRSLAHGRQGRYLESLRQDKPRRG